MKFDLRITDNLEMLHKVKNVTIDDVFRVYCFIRENHSDTLKSFSYSSKQIGRKYYITDNGIEHTFTNKRDAYIYLVKTYGTFNEA